MTGVTSEILIASPPTRTLFDSRQQAELAVEAYRDLGLPADIDEFERYFKNLHRALSSEGFPADRDLEPFIPLQLDDGFGLRALISAFDMKQERPSYVFEPVWKQYTTADCNSASESDSAFASAMLLGGDQYEPGLHHVCENVYIQIALAHTACQAYDAQHQQTNLTTQSVADYIILNAQRRHEGKQLLDAKGTSTNFLSMPMARMDKTNWVGSASCFEGNLWLSGTILRGPYGGSDNDRGVRFIISKS